MEIIRRVKMNDQNQRDDRRISNALMASFVILTIQYFILIYFNFIGTTIEPKIQFISKILVGAAYLYALPAVFRRGNLQFIFIYAIAAILFLLNYMLFPVNQVYLRELITPLFFLNLPALIYSMSINNWNELYAVMKRSSSVVFIIGIILGGSILSGMASIGTYSMSLSYYMLLPTIFFLNDLINKFSFKYLLMVLASFIVILAFGSRGAILCVIVFLLIKILRSFIEQKQKRKIGDILLFLMGLLTCLYIDRILVYINGILLKFGIESRSLSLLINDDAHLSGRDLLYEKIIAEIIRNPLWGNGLAGDRTILGGKYTHNILLEIMVEFGLLVGSILLLFLLILMLKGLLIKEKSRWDMITIWFALGFVHLMVSASYLTDFKFWIFLGILLSGIFNKKNKTVQI